MTEYTEVQMILLKEKIKELLAITKTLESEFDRSFSIDGHLLGSIGEIFAGYHYGITLYKQSEKTHDGIIADGREVQIKITQGKHFSFRKEPDYLIALHLDIATGEITEVYNGKGNGLLTNNMNNHILLSKLLELNKTAEGKIPAMHPVKQYQKNVTDYKSVKTNEKNNQQGATLVTGYVNKNQQMNCGCTGEPGNHEGQLYYWMKCLHCGHEYKANGCDVWLRICPACMKRG